MRVMIDTNVLLDVLCNRDVLSESSANVWKLCETKNIQGYISSLSVPNIVYIMRKELDPKKTAQLVDSLTLIFDIAGLDESDLKAAARMYISDYEDAVQICQAKRIKADAIITRNVKDFKDSDVPIITPEEFLRLHT